jgi:hypothetical protein
LRRDDGGEAPLVGCSVVWARGRVQEDFLSGVTSAVQGTPTFFTNGVRHDGSSDFASLLSAVQLALVPSG